MADSPKSGDMPGLVPRVEGPDREPQKRSRWRRYGAPLLSVVLLLIAAQTAVALRTQPDASSASDGAITSQQGEEHASITPPAAASVRPEPVTPRITVSGNRILRDQQPWWFVGYNSFVWSGDCGAPEERMSRAQMDDWFGSMRQDGHGIVRLYFFPGWDLADLDHAVDLARQKNVYLALTLDDALAHCGTPAQDAAWFSDSAALAAYRAHLTLLLTRYKDEPVFAWFEYFNEPSFSNGKLREFYDQMGEYAHSIDPTRLFSSGTVAPYWLGDDESSLNNPNFAAVSASPGVDIVSMHEYDGNEVISNHLDNVLANSAGKPVFVGEFGIKASATGAGCDLSYERRAPLLLAKAAAYVTAPGSIGGAVWDWRPGSAAECNYATADDEYLSPALRGLRP